MQPVLPLVAALLVAAPALAQGAPLEIDILEPYLATRDAAPDLPHCARHSGYVVVPSTGILVPGPAATNGFLAEHFEFHLQMHDGPGGAHFSPDDEDRYGDLFLEWHEYFVGLYQRWRADNGYPPLAGWDPATPMPPELAYEHPGRGCSPNRNSDPQVPWPTWGTVEGGEEPDPIHGHRSLCDFQDRNQFGKALADTWHRGWHAGVAGEFRMLQGPRDPAFWAGHQFLIERTNPWQEGCAGASAAAPATAAEEAPRSVPGAGLAALVPLALAALALRARAKEDARKER